MGRSRWLVAIALSLAASAARAEQGGSCHGQNPAGRGGMMMDEDHRNDMEIFRFLLEHGAVIERTVRELPNGVETVTESNDPEVAQRIREHVRAMYRRVKEDRPIHARGPLFAEIFRHADAIKMTIEVTDRGLKVVETSDEAYVAKLIKAHARVVSAFIDNGHSEMRQNHELPGRE